MSSSVSHLAFDGLSSSQNQTTRPNSTDGKPSSRNSHCQPLRFSRPSMFRIYPEASEPSAIVTGIAIINSALARAR
ncbi:hypothetical protein D3C85_1598620 [compost metagenome]